MEKALGGDRASSLRVHVERGDGTGGSHHGLKLITLRPASVRSLCPMSKMPHPSGPRTASGSAKHRCLSRNGLSLSLKVVQPARPESQAPPQQLRPSQSADPREVQISSGESTTRENKAVGSKCRMDAMPYRVLMGWSDGSHMRQGGKGGNRSRPHASLSHPPIGSAECFPGTGALSVAK
jgi:hypothetical protein